MLGFLKKIRHNQIIKGATKKYLLYALGEIALVMIGILAALQVNNWNENRNLKKQEKILLSEIHSEFEYNLSEFNSNSDRYLSNLESLKNISKLFPINIEKIDKDSLANLLENTHFIGNYDYSNVSLMKMHNSKSIDIISNEKLRNLLIRWEVLLSDYLEMESQTLTNYSERYGPLINDQISRPYKKGFLDKRSNLKFLSTIQFENLILTRQKRILNLFRIINTDYVEIDFIKVMEDIIKLSGND